MSNHFYFDKPREVRANFYKNALQAIQSGLNFLYLNIVSLRNKLDSLETF